MLNLAIEFNDRFINIKDIAEKEKISVKFLENIVSLIKPTGLIEVKRGAGGGYRLAKAPENIYLSELFELFEGHIKAPANENPGKTEEVTERVWNEINLKIKEYLDSKSLKDLVISFTKKNKNYMFYI